MLTEQTLFHQLDGVACSAPRIPVRVVFKVRDQRLDCGQGKPLPPRQRAPAGGTTCPGRLLITQLLEVRVHSSNYAIVVAVMRCAHVAVSIETTPTSVGRRRAIHVEVFVE